MPLIDLRDTKEGMWLVFKSRLVDGIATIPQTLVKEAEKAAKLIGRTLDLSDIRGDFEETLFLVTPPFETEAEYQDAVEKLGLEF